MQTVFDDDEKNDHGETTPLTLRSVPHIFLSSLHALSEQSRGWLAYQPAQLGPSSPVFVHVMRGCRMHRHLSPDLVWFPRPRACSVVLRTLCYDLIELFFW
jgi:hypothetical protein